MIFDDVKKQYIEGLLATDSFLVKSVKENPYTLRGGKKSYMYLDQRKLASSSKAYKAFIDGISYLLIEEYGHKEFILCNVDSKISAQMVGSLAYKLDKPQIIFKSKELTAVEKGEQQQLSGDLNWNLPVAIPDDVMTGGDGTAKNVGDLVRGTFHKIKDVQIFVGFIRQPKESTFETHYLITRDELIDIIWSNLSKDQQKAIDRECKEL